MQGIYINLLDIPEVYEIGIWQLLEFEQVRVECKRDIYSILQQWQLAL